MTQEARQVRVARPFFPEDDIPKILSNITEVLRSGIMRNGENLALFEKMFAEYIGVKEAVALNSEGSALELAMQHYQVQGREVIVCTNSFIAVPNSVVFAGGRPVFADIRPITLSLDPGSLREKISEKTCGVVVTHIAGFPNPDLPEILEICQGRGLFLVEDACHAAGATLSGRRVGSFGGAACFSLMPTKVITTGEGGLLATDDVDLATWARTTRNYGAGKERDMFIELGRNMLMCELLAILGIYQLRRISEFMEKRSEVAKVYDEGLRGNEVAAPMKPGPDCWSNYYKYPGTLSEGIDRESLSQMLRNEYGVETGTSLFPPCHMQDVYMKLFGAQSQLPVSENVLPRTITLPIHAAMNTDDALYVLRSLLSSFKRIGRSPM